MLTITPQQFTFTRHGIFSTVLIGILFLDPCVLPRCLAQQDEKDKAIEQLKQIIISQKRIIDDFDKRLRDSQVSIQAELRNQADAIKNLIQKQKLQADESKRLLELRQREGDEFAKFVRELQTKLLASQDEAKRAKEEALVAEARANLLQARIDLLLAQVRESTQKAAVAEVKNKVNPPKREPVANPPVIKVDGKIEKLAGDLVQINLGTDHGLEKNHTLEVYRLQPEAKYLGMIRIVEVSATSAIARSVAPPGKAALKVGDRVTSKLTLESK